MPRTLLGWSTLSGHLPEPPFTKSWIYPSYVSACWHVCLTTCVPVCTSECLHVCIFAFLQVYLCIRMTASLGVCMSVCLHDCIHVHVSYVFACTKKGVMSACLCEWLTGKKNPLWVGASDGGLTCCTTLLADLWSCCPHIKVLLFLITIWLKLDMNLGQKTENYHLQEKFKWQRLL